MNKTSDDSGLWQPCPPGEFGRIAGRLKRKRRLRAALRAAPIATLLLVGVGSIWLRFGAPFLQNPDANGEYHYGGITCTELHRVVPALKAGTLDDATLARVRRHLELCPHCTPFRKWLPDPPQTAWGQSLGRTEIPAGSMSCTRSVIEVSVDLQFSSASAANWPRRSFVLFPPSSSLLKKGGRGSCRAANQRFSRDSGSAGASPSRRMVVFQ